MTRPFVVLRSTITPFGTLTVQRTSKPETPNVRGERTSTRTRLSLVSSRISSCFISSCAASSVEALAMRSATNSTVSPAEGSALMRPLVLINSSLAPAARG